MVRKIDSVNTNTVNQQNYDDLDGRDVYIKEGNHYYDCYLEAEAVTLLATSGIEDPLNGITATYELLEGE